MPSLKPAEDLFLSNNYCDFSNIIYQRAVKLGKGLSGVKKIQNGSDRMNFVRHLKASGDEYAKAIGIPAIHTSDVHDVTFGKQPYGDFFFSDMLSGLFDFSGTPAVLDFGCSTGRVIRNLKSAYPNMDAYGCDPRQSSIDFIKPRVPEVNWFTSSEAPPLSQEKLPRFDMVFAISVWSHFSEKRGIEWFKEMAERTSDDGKLIITTHGFRSVYHFLQVKKTMPEIKAKERLESLRKGQLHFMPYPQNDLDNHWGMAFLSRQWMERKLKGIWKVDGFFPGLAMANQDTFVLVK